ncbi:glycosyl transferase family 90 [Polaribacter staleyi]|uniref:glycosyl transferase family 90 n=1 Tax=Polaribacter staleyi TaxID=2022337 RepID=UPI0031BBA822
MSLFNFFKRSKVLYYIQNGFLDVLPRSLFHKKLNNWINNQNNYSKKETQERVSYYINPNLPKENIKGTLLKNLKKKGHKSMYYYDFMKYGRYFNQNLAINYTFGDVDTDVESISFVKSRPINHNGNSVLLPLDSLRHFHFIKDSKSFSEKKNEAVWRGVIHKENRRLLVDNFHDHPKMNIGTTHQKNSKPNWIKDYLTLENQLAYKFIISIEGIDVATNLKWIMSSNSLCFMPKPKFETWYMEGKLTPNFHYVLIEDDYSDLEAKMDYYSKNIDEAEKIIVNAKNWTQKFKDKKLEKLLSLKVMNNYFKSTNQIN